MREKIKRVRHGLNDRFDHILELRQKSYQYKLRNCGKKKKKREREREREREQAIRELNSNWINTEANSNFRPTNLPQSRP